MEKREKERIKIMLKEQKIKRFQSQLVLAIIILWIFTILILPFSAAHGTELSHKFKSPSFSGVGVSSHYLTIENQQKSRTDQIASDIEAALLAARRAEDSSLLSKFVRNFESRVYSQLSKQLVDSLFDGTGAQYGSFVLEGNTITYQVQPCDDLSTCAIGDEVISMDIIADDGSTTNITIPVGAGTF
jgi:hypothetical protein